MTFSSLSERESSESEHSWRECFPDRMVQARPNRGPMLMVWIRAVLVVHTSYLMTVPDLARVLSGTIVGVYTWPSVYISGCLCSSGYR